MQKETKKDETKTKSIPNNKMIILIAGLVVVIFCFLFVYYVLNSRRSSVPIEPLSQQALPTSNDATSQTYMAGNDAIAVSDQPPSETVVIGLVVLKDPGYVVIHKDSNGSPGEIIGHSKLLSSGENINLKFELDEPTLQGNYYFAMLHIDDGDGEFNFPGNDEPIKDIENDIIMMKFLVSEDSELNENSAISF